jgi:hypothetical protein
VYPEFLGPRLFAGEGCIQNFLAFASSRERGVSRISWPSPLHGRGVYPEFLGLRLFTGEGCIQNFLALASPGKRAVFTIYRHPPPRG